MKEFIETFNKNKKLNVNDYPRNKIDPEKVSPAAIILRLTNQAEVPSDILRALNLIPDEKTKKEYVVMLFRICNFARTLIGHGSLKRWFLDGKIHNPDGTTYTLSQLKKKAGKVLDVNAKTIDLEQKIIEKSQRAEEQKGKKRDQAYSAIDLLGERKVQNTQLFSIVVEEFLEEIRKVNIYLGSEKR